MLHRTVSLWRSRKFRALVLFPLAFVNTAALNLLIEEAQNVILPANAPFPTGQVATVSKGGVIYRQALGRSHVVQISEDISFTQNGQIVVIAKADHLIESKVQGTMSRVIGYGSSLYCTPAKPTGKKRVVGLSEFSELGGDLDAVRKLRHIHVQNCIVDRNQDGIAERAFLADNSVREDIFPSDIPPVRISSPGVVRMPGESEVRMVFDGPVGILGNISTSLVVIEEGKRLAFSNGQMLFQGSALPKTISFFGGQFTILSYDRKSKTAQIRLDRPFSPVSYGVTTTFTRN
jgi:hypothetical protein